MENPEDDLIYSEDEVELQREVVPEQALEAKVPEKKKLGSSEVIEIPPVSTRQYLAPFCSTKYPQLIVPVIPEKQAEASSEDPLDE